MHHNSICRTLGVTSLESYHMDLEILAKLTERVRVAKQLFKTSFIYAQSSKQDSWVNELARDSGLEPDEYMMHEMGSDDQRDRARKVAAMNTKAQKQKLKTLLDTAIEKSSPQSRRRSDFIVVAK